MLEVIVTGLLGVYAGWLIADIHTTIIAAKRWFMRNSNWSL